MKIALYSGAIPSTVFIERLIAGLAGQGAEVLLFGRQQGRVHYADPHIRCLGYTSRLHMAWLLLRYVVLFLLFRPGELMRLRKVIGQRHTQTPLRHWAQYLGVLWHRPAILHLQWAKSVGHWMWVQDFGIKLVLSLRGAHINYSPIADASLDKLYQTSFPALDGFHAVSHTIGQEAMRYGADPAKTKVIYSGLNLNKFPFTTRPARNKDTLRILSVGRDHWKKGYTYALDACHLLMQRHMDVEYTIIGAGSEEYIFQVHQLGLSGRVHFLGKLPHEQVLHHMQQADVLLLSSVEEGIANVVLEAMALGLPVISTRCGGMEEVLRHGENGLLVEVRNPEQIAQAVMDFSRMPEKEIMAMTRKARATIEARFEQSRMAKEMMDFYGDVWAGRPAVTREVSCAAS